MGVMVSPALSNACPNGFRASPPCGLIWQVLQPSTAGLRNGSLRYICRNSGIANAGALHNKKSAIPQIRIIGPPPTRFYTVEHSFRSRSENGLSQKQLEFNL